MIGMNDCQSKLPLVIQVGFSGSRRLYDESIPEEQIDSLDIQVIDELEKVLTELHQQLSIPIQYFTCGISQMAIGADMLFAQACKNREIRHRIFLPQLREDFLNAENSDGTLDFAEKDKQQALELLESPNIIQERVVSNSLNRNERFVETNVEILRVSDLIICLSRKDAIGKTGGTNEQLARAKKQGVPALEIIVDVDENFKAKFDSQWHNKQEFVMPHLPHEMEGLSCNIDTLSTVGLDDYCKLLKTYGSPTAKWFQKLFRIAATFIILTHVIATLLATIGLAGHELHLDHHIHRILLFFELSLLTLGLIFHVYLHRTHAGRKWAFSRLVSQIATSVRTSRNIPVYLSYLFRLPIPESLRSVLRTLNVLHLETFVKTEEYDWKQIRCIYADQRIGSQLQYYENKIKSDKFYKKLSEYLFVTCTFASVLIGLLGLFVDGLSVGFAIASIVLPLISVAAVTLAAAADLDARIETFTELVIFLRKQKPLAEASNSAKEFEALLLETEERLLGETVNWYSRRCYLGVA